MQVDKENKLMWTKNRNVLPPVSDKADFTVLDDNLMSQYFKLYNDYLASDKRFTSPKYMQNESWGNIIKRNCK